MRLAFITIPLFLILLTWNQALARTFRDEQQRFPRVRAARTNTENVRARLFREADVNYPPKQIFIRAFKLERILELWAIDDDLERFKLIKSYPFTSFSGDLGPKRQQGDLQIPEGFYHINNFNPWSSYHLSLQINYPNKSDRILKKGEDTGGLIFIHGSEVTIGCIPIGDRAIEELYVAAVDTKDNGQDKIPVHIFPYQMNTPERDKEVEIYYEENPEYKEFWHNLKTGFDIFQKTKCLPEFTIDNLGKYHFSSNSLEDNDKPEINATSGVNENRVQELRMIRVFVALCDNDSQGIVPVSKMLGNGLDPDNNLYWGGMYGLRTVFDKHPNWKRIRKIRKYSDQILERIIYEYKGETSHEESVYLVADAYRGGAISDAVIDFLYCSALASRIEYFRSEDNIYLPLNNPDLVAYVGHNGLMDFYITGFEGKDSSNTKRSPPVIIMCCLAKDYFPEYLRITCSYPLLWTTGLCAPEAYVLEAALDGWIADEDDKKIADRAAQAYSDNQPGCSFYAARRLWITGW